MASGPVVLIPAEAVLEQLPAPLDMRTSVRLASATAKHFAAFLGDGSGDLALNVANTKFQNAKPLRSHPTPDVMRDFYESVGGTVKLASMSERLAKRALKKLEVLNENMGVVVKQLSTLDPAESDENSTVKKTIEEATENERSDSAAIVRERFHSLPIPPWEFHSVRHTLGKKVVMLGQAALKQTEAAIEDAAGAVNDFSKAGKEIVNGEALSKVHQRSKQLITPEVLGRFEAVKPPPPLLHRFTGAGHKPGVWCREVCMSRDQKNVGKFAPPPWLRHSQSWNKHLLDYHIAKGQGLS